MTNQDEDKDEHKDELEYNQISADWRHRDNLTWQIPSFIVAIGGLLITAAFSLNMEPQYEYIIRAILIGFAAALSFCLTIALGQNLWYQLGSTMALERIVKGKGDKLPENTSRRTLLPKDFDDCDFSSWDIVKRLSKELTGSTLLFLLCIVITVVFWGLLVWHLII